MHINWKPTKLAKIQRAKIAWGSASRNRNQQPWQKYSVQKLPEVAHPSFSHNSEGRQGSTANLDVQNLPEVVHP